MSQIIIENISKKYIISHKKKQLSTFKDAFSEFFENFFSKNDEEEEIFWALDDVSFEINQGDRVGIVGSNGAGKSTLLKVLSRITEPTKGQVKMRGRLASLLEVGTGFHPELTGRENIFLNGAILGMRQNEIKSQFDAIVDFAGIEKFLDTPVKRYSSGMYVRLGFAIAAHLEPEILIVDEVLAVGDAEFQKKCLGKMKDVSNSGRTLLFVSHNHTAVQGLCNKAAYLEKGKLVEYGETTHVLGTYMQRAAQFKLKQIWDSPATALGNDFVRVKSIELIPEFNTPNITGKHRSIDVKTPIKIHFEFWNMLENADLNLSMFLFEMGGNCIFNVCNMPKNFSKGVVAGDCEIPGNFLNDGNYYISMMVVKDTTTALYFMEEAISFEVVDQREGGSSWYGKWPGAIRPMGIPISIYQP